VGNVTVGTWLRKMAVASLWSIPVFLWYGWIAWAALWVASMAAPWVFSWVRDWRDNRIARQIAEQRKARVRAATDRVKTYAAVDTSDWRKP
jgi:hypothetical protein